ncbi:MAG TPA: ribbon-helix-helix protein, CopG family [Candidatus Sulfotelmatobacter sp.]|nr:ribbon-helix-helix protein, CopG family [Candidatus Sulfotelmatobacter sp.]
MPKPVYCRLEDPIYERFVKAANAEYLSLSSAMRQAIAMWLKKKEKR